MHEYGHTIDSRLFGPAYLFGIGIPSIISAAGDGDHRRFWAERRANRKAKKYFEKHYGINWDSPYKGYEERKATDENGNTYYYWYDYTIEDYYPIY